MSVGVEEAAAVRRWLLVALKVSGGSPAPSTGQLAGDVQSPLCLPPPPYPHPTVTMRVPVGVGPLGAAGDVGRNLRRADSSGGLPGGEGGWLEGVQA